MTTGPGAKATGVLERMAGGLVVSCQAREGEPLHGPEFMVAMALSAVAGGAVGVRLEGQDDLRAAAGALSVPIIGLEKVGHGGVYITPTMSSALAVADTGVAVVAMDGTGRPRPDGSSLADVIGAVHDRGCLVMADISTVAEGVAVVDAGADVLSTTLSGYTPYSRQGAGPDLRLVAELAERVAVPVFAEGRITEPVEAMRALRAGAYAVVVGSAITRPTVIARRFAVALNGGGRP